MKTNKSKAEIASILSVDRSIIYRELKRNCDGRSGKYKALLAQWKYENRLVTKPNKIRVTPEIKTRFFYLIRADYIPEQVVGFLKKNKEETVSHETIYRLIWDDKKRKGNLYKHLRRRGRRYRKRGNRKDSRGKIIGRVGIENRPKEAEKREVFVHFEVDTIIGKDHKGAIITLNERTSGMLYGWKKLNLKTLKSLRRN